MLVPPRQIILQAWTVDISNQWKVSWSTNTAWFRLYDLKSFRLLDSKMASHCHTLPITECLTYDDWIVPWTWDPLLPKHPKQHPRACYSISACRHIHPPGFSVCKGPIMPYLENPHSYSPRPSSALWCRSCSSSVSVVGRGAQMMDQPLVYQFPVSC